MKKLAIAAFLAMTGLAAIPAAASAMRPAPSPAAGAGIVHDIAYGCPRGYVPNRGGRCVPAPGYRGGYGYGNGYGYNRGPVPANRSGYGRVCPRGTHLGPRGRYCQPN